MSVLCIVPVSTRPVRACLLALLAGALASCGAPAAEPPFEFGSADAGAKVRKTSIKQMVASPPVIVYEVEYPAKGLTSLATVDLRSRAMVEEVFPGKWRVSYEYRDARDRAMKVPTAIVVYGDRGGSWRELNRYELKELVPQDGARYRDGAGRSRLIPYTYFDVMPGGPF
jgi:hypothetical protein